MKLNCIIVCCCFVLVIPKITFAQGLLSRGTPEMLREVYCSKDVEETLPTLEDNEFNGQSNDKLIVYGRDNCGISEKYVKDLQASKVEFIFKDIDDKKNAREFVVRANEAKMFGSINLPVIYDQGKLSSRPDIAVFINKTHGGHDNNAAVANQQQGTNEQSSSQITIYGGRRCGWTQKYIKEFQQAGIPFVFKDIDDQQVYNEISNRLSASGFSGSINSPVIDINGKLSSRPNIAEILKSHAQSASPTLQKDTNGKQLSDQKNIVIIYSVRASDYTRQYMDDLTKIGIKFVYKDCDDPRIHKEFSKEMIAAGYRGSVNLPAIVINKKVYIKPSLAETMQLVNK